MSILDNIKVWVGQTAFKKTGEPVMGNFGSIVQTAAILTRGEWLKLDEGIKKIESENKLMREALERRDAAILWMFVNGPDGVDGVEKDCYAFAEDAAGEKDRPTDTDGIEGYLRMLESHEDFQSCLEAVRRNVKHEAIKRGKP